MVVSVPETLFIQGYREQVRIFQPFQMRLPADGTPSISMTASHSEPQSRLRIEVLTKVPISGKRGRAPG